MIGRSANEHEIPATPRTFPSAGPAIAHQTIGIIAPLTGYCGYLQSDINLTLGAAAPNVIELSQIPASRERTAAILEETGAVCSQMGRCATFAARMDEEPVSKAALVVLMTVLTALTAGFQVAEAITAATTSEQPLQLA